MRELATMRQVMDRLFEEDMFRLAGGWDRNGGEAASSVKPRKIEVRRMVNGQH